VRIAAYENALSIVRQEAYAGLLHPEVLHRSNGYLYSIRPEEWANDRIALDLLETGTVEVGNPLAGLPSFLHETHVGRCPVFLKQIELMAILETLGSEKSNGSQFVRARLTNDPAVSQSDGDAPPQPSRKKTSRAWKIEACVNVLRLKYPKGVSDAVTDGALRIELLEQDGALAPLNLRTLRAARERYHKEISGA
jgi:hypothetical protein